MANIGTYINSILHDLFPEINALCKYSGKIA